VAPRFDGSSHTIELSVADVLERGPAPGLRGGMERLWLGQAIHSRYQERALAADPSYRSEVWLEHAFPHGDWLVTLRGRADGVRRAPDGALVVEEIKTLRRSAPSRSVRALAERQVGLYAWLLSETGDDPVRAELIWIEPAGDTLARDPIELDLARVADELRATLERWIADWQRDEREREARHSGAARIRFPHAQARPGQQEISDAVAQALASGEHLLVQAPTGIGKTVAALTPALRHALAEDARVFVLTSKGTQQEMALRVLGLLNEEGAFRSLRMRAKAGMCTNDQLLCHEDYCRFLRDFSTRLESSGVWERIVAGGPMLLPDAIRAAGRETELCPFELSLIASRRSQVVVGDYNYAFDPYAALTDFGPEADLRHTVLVIDEVHNLVERGREYYSPTLDDAPIRRVADWAAGLGTQLGGAIAAGCGELLAAIDSTLEAATPPGEPLAWAQEAPLPEDRLQELRPRLERLFVDYLEFRRSSRSLAAEDPFVELYFDVLRFLDGLAAADHSFGRFAERSGKSGRLRLLCLDPGRLLGGVLNRCHAVIGLSATLSPLEFYRSELGFDAARTDFVTVPDPFPPENRRVVIDPSVATHYREREASYDTIAARLGAFADAVGGNCLALFPSYRFLDEIARRLKPGAKRVLVQRPTDGERERAALLEQLRGGLRGDLLLLAVSGGVFAEGVDYPGDALRAVAVVGPCLPALSLERELLRAGYEETFERGFEYAYVVPGMTRVLQAAGRLIRSELDTGVIALFGRRFIEPPYCDYLPPEWLPPGGLEDLVGDPAEVAREFFASR
jgi:DNA excision repair protein ERCC-2